MNGSQSNLHSYLHSYLYAFLTNTLLLARGALVLLGCLLLGRLLSLSLLPALPGSILGMLLLTLLLSLGWIRPGWIEPAASPLLRWLSLLFVPVSVGLVERLPLLASQGLLMLICISVSTLLVLLFTGWLWQRMEWGG